MKTAPRMHRSTAIMAAVLMILTQISSISASRASISADTTGFMLMDILVNTLVTILLAVMLFRGRKDAVAGAVFLFTLFVPLLSAGYELLTVLLGFELILYAVLSAASGLVMAVFRGLLAGECLSQGGISAGAGRIFLWMLPTVVLLCEIAEQVVLYRYYGMNNEDIMVSVAVVVIPQCLAPILMGVSFLKGDKADRL